MARLPTAINLHKASKTLSLTYAPGEVYQLPAEFLRVHSPSAEVKATATPFCSSARSTSASSASNPPANMH